MNQANPFPYYVGINRLQDIANKNTRVCVMNILGGESSGVTPISHEFSGGNVVAGVQYGKSGQIVETKLGDIPVFGSVKEVVDSGVEFDTGVVYIPPAGVAAAVDELVTHNEKLTKIVVLTEKVSVKDSQFIRAFCQKNEIDVFGGNCLGIGNSWDQVRVGGALGGNVPAESLVKGCVAVYSNSGNFSTTIPEYLKTAGWGTSSVLSSGKDLYIQFALAEFLNAAQKDARTQAVMLYIEPGGYYEKQALDWIRDGIYTFAKPMVVCVTGRWKAGLTRAVGHAGAIAGGGDDALAKEQWFDDYFGQGVFDPENPRVSGKGIRIESIQDAPTAMTAVMKELGIEPDFPPTGDLSLKPWFVSDQQTGYPDALKMQAVEAMAPYNETIRKIGNEIGAQISRESMRNKSGASQMNNETGATDVHGISTLDLAAYPFGGTSVFTLTKRMPEESEMPMVNAILNYFVTIGAEYMETAAGTRANDAMPNAYIGAAVWMNGDRQLFKDYRAITHSMIDLFYTEIQGDMSVNEAVVDKALRRKGLLPEGDSNGREDAIAAFMAEVLEKNGLESIFTRYALKYGEANRVNKLTVLMSAMLLSLSWKSLVERRIPRETALDLGNYLCLNGVVVACAAPDYRNNGFWKKLTSLENLSLLNTDFSGTCFRILFNRIPKEKELFGLNAVLNLSISNGPGTVSAKGAKESVSAGNPIATCYAGWLSNLGQDHGGNGFRTIKYMKDRMGDFDPYKASSADDLNRNLEEIAQKAAEDFAVLKKKAKEEGDLKYFKIPSIGHPVFKGKPVNHDPREAHLRNLLKERNEVNPFQEFYHHLVRHLFEVGANRNVFCVNIDAATASISLDLLWKDIESGRLPEKTMQDIAFTLFLFARAVGCSAEIADHRSRGNPIDCRTPPDLCLWVG
ncbi:MAG: CoA-binding protein [Proteobacteria bacterium]|nr:CoA-binding protein [Pseudomonadota bacterium]